MTKLTIADAAQKLQISKEAIHNRIRRGSLQSVIEDGVKLVIIDSSISTTTKRISPKRTSGISNDRYYKFLEEQNVKLQGRVDTLEGETRSLRDQKEQMLIEERQKIEQIYKEKDEQLKNILSAISSKFMLNTTQIIDTQKEDDELVEAEIQESNTKEKEKTPSRLISLNKYLKNQEFSKDKREKIKNKFKKASKSDARIITIGKKFYIDLDKYDYSDLSL